jgi:TonB family protein
VLNTTYLVHESYLRFVHIGELRAEDRRVFFAYASQVMRSVIVNSVRERIAQKRGGDWPPLTLSTRGRGCADCMKAPNPLPVDPAATSSKTTSSGKVILQIFVSPTGTVDGAIVWQSSGFPKLDEAELKAVLHQKLTPATQGGQPVPTCVKMPIVFKLDNK